MLAKALEVRDTNTFLPVLAVEMNPVVHYDSGHSDRQLVADEGQRYLLRRCGYPCDGKPNIIFTRLDGNGTATNDPYHWPSNPRTFRIAHLYIIKNWETLKDGDVVDVEHILGITTTPKTSERLSHPVE